LERSDNPGIGQKQSANPERVRQLANPFRVDEKFVVLIPGLSLRSSPGLGLANAFGVIIEFNGGVIIEFGVVMESDRRIHPISN